MGLFTNKEKNNKAFDILSKHDKGEIDDKTFLIELSKETLYYSTPYGEHKDGGNRLFLLPGGNNMGYQPVFSSKEKLIEYYEKAGRTKYMYAEGSLLGFLTGIKAINEGKAPVDVGGIIDPGTFDITIDPSGIDKIIKTIE